MFFYSLVSFVCHFGPILTTYTTARSLLELSTVKSLMHNSESLSTELPSFVMSHLYLLLSYYLHTVFLYFLIYLSFSVLLLSPVMSLVFPPGCWASCTLPPTSPETTPVAHWCFSPLLPSSLHLLYHKCYHSPPLLLCPWSGFLLWIERVSLMCEEWVKKTVIHFFWRVWWDD